MNSRGHAGQQPSKNSCLVCDLDEPAAWGYRLCDLMALACSHLGLVDQAIRWGSMALDLDPNDERLSNNLAYYRKAGRRECEIAALGS
jgi:hypothetical protein